LGEEKHNLTTPETPAHGHTVGDSGNHRHWSCGALPRNFQWDVCEGNDAPVAVGYGDGCWHGNQVDEHTSWDGNHSHNLSQTGGGQPHNNMQPSIVVYMFQRTG
ncbi:phage baseplate protein, partial [Acidaminococcus sp.]|uniref:phage baseplate protein n=1 Tax=Acidaminococcus sp. TaxID=1872103 RepID=UPI003D7D0F40